MSVVESDIQWFIARDGKQHGPLSDVEMRKLVELSHLRTNDLLWRQGFPDWRPALSVFPMAAPEPLTAAPPAARPGRKKRPAHGEPDDGEPDDVQLSDLSPARVLCGAARDAR